MAYIELFTERLKLVPMNMSFLSTTHAYASDAESNKYMLNLPNETIEETADFLKYCEMCWNKEIPDSYEFAVFCGEDHIGAASLSILDDGETAELGWILNRSFWGNGYAIETARELVRFASEELNIKNFVAHCDAENIHSERVMKKLGMEFAGQYIGRKNRISEEEREEKEYKLSL